MLDLLLGEYNGRIEQSSSVDQNFQEILVRDRIGSSIVSENRVEMIFPVLGLIFNELLQLYKSKSNMNERNSAIIIFIISVGWVFSYNLFKFKIIQWNYKGL